MSIDCNFTFQFELKSSEEGLRRAGKSVPLTLCGKSLIMRPKLKEGGLLSTACEAAQRADLTDKNRQLVRHQQVPVASFGLLVAGPFT